MFLTLFYMIATWLKAWQLHSIRTKLLQHVSNESCVVFYKVSDDVEECSRACSSLCVNPKGAHISDVLTVKGQICGCALRPTRSLCLDTWRAPPPSPARLAILPNLAKLPSTHLTINKVEGVVLPSTSKAKALATDEISLLVECDLNGEEIEEIDILPNCEHWHICAWQMGRSRLALALKGNMEHFASLAATFLNSNSPLLRLQTVSFSGTPLALNDKESLAVSRATIHGSPRHRSKYLSTLEKICKSAPNSVQDTPEKKQIAPVNQKIHLADAVPSSSPKKSVQHLNNTLSDIKENGATTSNVVSDVKNADSAVTNGQLSARKSDLKLELSNKSAPEKPHTKTVSSSSSKSRSTSQRKSFTKTLGKRSSSKSSILDEPISLGEKSNKGGASCPSLPIVRPPNILVYSDSAVTRENIARTLKNVLDPERYAVYCSGEESTLESVGPLGTSLIVVGGALPSRASSALLVSLLGGARVLSLCSDLILTVLPYYRTAEVRERELASFTYDKWRSVKLLHHVFCYQASPARRQFSAAPTAHPTEYKGHNGHVLKVDVLAAEQTWHTPSLLQATDERSGGTAIFSQVHLELDAREYLSSEGSSAELARLGVLKKLVTALGLSTAPSPLTASLQTEPQYMPAYFLGTYERKLEAAESVASGRLHLVQPKDSHPPATSTHIPLFLHLSPNNFSTLIYFEELHTIDIGRLVVYTEKISSTQDLIVEKTRYHGLVVVADRQTTGSGRGGTTWLSPPGCLMFSVQLHAPMSGHIAGHASLIQHISALSIVDAVRTLSGYEDIDLRIKWPNDIYLSRNAKLGGLIVNSCVEGNRMIFNIGIGFNLDNKNPTTCLNDIIKQYYPKLAVLAREKLLALTLNRLENIFSRIETTGDFSEFFKLYYKYWLHEDETIQVIEEGAPPDKEPVSCRILGLDEYGYLRALGSNGEITLRPDGNTFDMMRGLIVPKLSH